MLQGASLAVYPLLSYVIRGNVTRAHGDAVEVLILRTVRA